MRNHLSILHLAALLTVTSACSPLPAGAGTVSVNTTSQTVETSRLLLQFDQGTPELLLQINYKDYSPTAILSSYYVDASEFWGQTMRNTSSTGFIRQGYLGTYQWQVTQQTATYAEITITSQATGQPTVVSRYRFFADQPYYAVDRTIRFSQMPDTAAYQPYLPRLAFFSTYHAARWRDTTGTVQQRGYCAIPCLESGWNGHWIEEMAYTGHTGIGVTAYFSSSQPSHMKMVDGWGPNSQTGWVAPIVPAGSHTQDETTSELIGFTTAPDNYARMDSMWTVYNSAAYLADVPAEATAPGLRLGVSPNPVRGRAAIEWTSASPGAYAIDVLDVAGRRLARVQAGWSAAGTHAASWDGRDDAGAAAPPGLYFVRLLAPGGTRVTRLVRAD